LSLGLVVFRLVMKQNFRTEMHFGGKLLTS
jgi:hypothetical protein